MSISYAIGKAEPTAVEIDTFGTARVDEDVIRLAVLDVFDLRPAAIMSLLHLRAPIYADTAAYGHFNGYKYSWENLDKTDELRKAVEKKHWRSSVPATPRAHGWNSSAWMIPRLRLLGRKARCWVWTIWGASW